MMGSSEADVSEDSEAIVLRESLGNDTYHFGQFHHMLLTAL